MNDIKNFKPLVIVVILVLAITAYFFINSSQKPTNIQEADKALVVVSEPEKVTQDFYNWYVQCLDKHFKNSKGKSPNENCDYKNNQYVSSQLSINLAKPRNIEVSNPFCASNTPEEVKIYKTTIDQSKANSIVHVVFGASGISPVSVDLELENGKWKIVDLSCIAI